MDIAVKEEFNNRIKNKERRNNEVEEVMGEGEIEREAEMGAQMCKQKIESSW